MGHDYLAKIANELDKKIEHEMEPVLKQCLCSVGTIWEHNIGKDLALGIQLGQCR